MARRVRSVGDLTGVSLECPATTCWLLSEATVRQVLPRRGSKEERQADPASGVPAAVQPHRHDNLEHTSCS